MIVIQRSVKRPLRRCEHTLHPQHPVAGHCHWRGAHGRRELLCLWPLQDAPAPPRTHGPEANIVALRVWASGDANHPLPPPPPPPARDVRCVPAPTEQPFRQRADGSIAMETIIGTAARTRALALSAARIRAVAQWQSAARVSAAGGAYALPAGRDASRLQRAVSVRRPRR